MTVAHRPVTDWLPAGTANEHPPAPLDSAHRYDVRCRDNRRLDPPLGRNLVLLVVGSLGLGCVRGLEVGLNASHQPTDIGLAGDEPSFPMVRTGFLDLHRWYHGTLRMRFGLRCHPALAALNASRSRSRCRLWLGLWRCRSRRAAVGSTGKLGSPMYGRLHPRWRTTSGSTHGCQRTKGLVNTYDLTGLHRDYTWRVLLVVIRCCPKKRHGLLLASLLLQNLH